MPDIYQQVMTVLGMNGTALNPSETQQFQMAVDAMVGQLQAYTTRHLLPAQWSDTFQYQSHRHYDTKIILGEYPIRKILNIYTGNGVTVLPSAYRVDASNGMMQWFYGSSSYWSPWIWGCCYGCDYADGIRIDYEAGFDPLPADLLMVISDFARDRLNSFRAQCSAANGGGSIALGEITAVQIEGVGRVQYRTAGSRMTSGFDSRSAASGGPILGAAASIADLYRDYQNVIIPDRHLMTSPIIAAQMELLR